MKSIPHLRNDFIVNEEEYQQCKAWLAEATEQTIQHPLEDPELEMQRRRFKEMVQDYESNWRKRTRVPDES